MGNEQPPARGERAPRAAEQGGQGSHAWHDSLQILAEESGNAALRGLAEELAADVAKGAEGADLLANESFLKMPPGMRSALQAGIAAGAPAELMAHYTEATERARRDQQQIALLLIYPLWLLLMLTLVVLLYCLWLLPVWQVTFEEFQIELPLYAQQVFELLRVLPKFALGMGGSALLMILLILVARRFPQSHWATAWYRLRCTLPFF